MDFVLLSIGYLLVILSLVLVNRGCQLKLGETGAEIAAAGNSFSCGYLSAGFRTEWYLLASMMSDSRGGFAFARYGDGEANIMNGIAYNPVQAVHIDNFSYAGGDSLLRTYLRKTIKGMRGRRFYYGFSQYPGLDKYIQEVDQTKDKIFSAFVPRDGNYEKTRLLLQELIEAEYGEIFLLCSQEALPNSRLPWAKVVIRFPGRCVEWFDVHGENILEEMRTLAKSVNRHLFLVATGPSAPVVIYEMFKANPRNRYVDLGSSLDEFVKGRKTRGYHYVNNSLRTNVIDQWYIDRNGARRYTRDKRLVLEMLYEGRPFTQC